MGTCTCTCTKVGVAKGTAELGGNFSVRSSDITLSQTWTVTLGTFLCLLLRSRTGLPRGRAPIGPSINKTGYYSRRTAGALSLPTALSDGVPGKSEATGRNPDVRKGKDNFSSHTPGFGPETQQITNDPIIPFPAHPNILYALNGKISRIHISNLRNSCNCNNTLIVVVVKSLEKSRTG